MSSTSRPWESAAEQGRAMLERWPALYVRVAQRRTPVRVAVDAKTDLLVEGFPRSGNSFLVSWIGAANPQLTIASHMHSIAHVHTALRRNIPVVIVVRPPEAAIASLAVFAPGRQLDQYIARYRRFHRGVLDVASEVLISPFQVTTSSPERVVEALRPRMVAPLATSPTGGKDEAIAAVDRRRLEFGGEMDETKVARPAPARQSKIERACEELRARHGRPVAELNALYSELVLRPTAITAAPAD